MKTVENRKVKLGNREISYAELIKVVCQNPPQGGFTVDDIRARMRVLDSVELAVKNGGPIQLEDADFDVFRRCLADMKWAVACKEIVEFNDAIEGALEKKR